MIDINKIDFNKSNGLVPAIIQDAKTNNVLMLGYMNKEAVERTIDTKLVTFWSRSKERLWQKGEASGNTLNMLLEPMVKVMFSETSYPKDISVNTLSPNIG